MSVRNRLAALERAFRTQRPAETQSQRILERIEGIAARRGHTWPSVPVARTIGELRDQIAAIITRRHASSRF